MAKTQSKDLTKLDSHVALATIDYGDDAGRGFENQSAADTSIPWLVLLQSMSPQVQDESRNPPLRPGNWFNSVTEQAWDKEGVLFVPSITQHRYTEWTSRNHGGGFHGHHEVDSPEVQTAIKNAKRYGKNIIEAVEYDKDNNPITKQHELAETFYVYGVICDEEDQPSGMAAIAFKSSMIRAYRGWMTRVREVRLSNGTRPPLYAHLTRLTSRKEKNAYGEFYIPQIAFGNPGNAANSLLLPSDERFQMAKACKELIDSGNARINFEKQGDDDGAKESPF